MQTINKLNEALDLTNNSAIRLKILSIIEELEDSNKGSQSFADWMIHKVKSVHYATMDSIITK